MGKTRTAPLIHIGASYDTIKAARAVILGILQVPYVGDKTKIEALRTFAKVCAVENTVISNCNLNG